MQLFQGFFLIFRIYIISILIHSKVKKLLQILVLLYSKNRLLTSLKVPKITPTLYLMLTNPKFQPIRSENFVR